MGVFGRRAFCNQFIFCPINDQPKRTAKTWQQSASKSEEPTSQNLAKTLDTKVEQDSLTAVRVKWDLIFTPIVGTKMFCQMEALRILTKVLSSEWLIRFVIKRKTSL